MELQKVVDTLWCKAIAPSTRLCCETGYQAHIQFLLLTGLIAHVIPHLLPINEDLLILFVAYCASRLKVSYSTIKLYLCGIRFRCIE